MAINAEASRTAATSASGTPVGLALATFSPRFRAPIRDQLVNQALVWGHIGEQAAKPRSRRAPSLYLRIGELGGLGHEERVTTIAAWTRERVPIWGFRVASPSCRSATVRCTDEARKGLVIRRWC
jgi:hypothetical protein